MSDTSKPWLKTAQHITVEGVYPPPIWPTELKVGDVFTFRCGPLTVQCRVTGVIQDEIQAEVIECKETKEKTDE